HATELRLLVEAHAVVDPPDLAVGSEQTVPGLPVGVVDHSVEQREPPEDVRQPFAQREEMFVGVELDEDLHRPRTVRTVSKYGPGNVGPPELTRDQVGGHLAIAQRP